MNRIFLDTSFLFAYHYEQDPYHKKAEFLMAKKLVDYAPFRFVITDYIFDEFVTIIKKKVSKKHAIKTGNLLLANSDFEFERITHQYFDEAWNVFCEFQDKQWSFTDCTSYVWLRENRPDFCLATDSDFDEFGLMPNLVRI